MAEIGILCGLAAEAEALGRWATDPRVAVAISGARADVALAKARVLAADARVLVSWGMAGGLAPSLASGSVLIGSEVVTEAGEHYALLVPPDRWGRPLLGAERLIASAGEKARLHAETHADSADMESLAVARAAAEAGIPAIAIRSVADPAAHCLPHFVEQALSADGRPRAGPILAGLLRRPPEALALWRLRSEARRALAALRRFAGTDLALVLDRAYSG